MVLIMESEIWKDIVGYEDYYQVSNQGRVKALERVVYRIDGKIKVFKEKIRKSSKDGSGYLSLILSKDNVQKRHCIHILVCVHFIPNPQNKEEVNHEDGNKTNNNDWNLTWATPKENQHHARTTGLINDAGENNTRAKFTNQQTIEIRSLASKMSQRQIGKIYGVAQSTIEKIINNKSYKTYDSK